MAFSISVFPNSIKFVLHVLVFVNVAYTWLKSFEEYSFLCAWYLYWKYALKLVINSNSVCWVHFSVCKCHFRHWFGWFGHNKQWHLSSFSLLTVFANKFKVASTEMADKGIFYISDFHFTFHHSVSSRCQNINWWFHAKGMISCKANSVYCRQLKSEKSMRILDEIFTKKLIKNVQS